MWTIATNKDVNYFKTQRSVVSVFLSDGYDSEEVQWVLDSWEAFNRDSNKFWQLLIPSKTGAFELNETRKRVDGTLDASLYNVSEADTIVRRNGLAGSEFPILAFENFSASGAPYVIELARYSRRETKLLLKDIAKLIREEGELGPQDPDEFREKARFRIEHLSRQSTSMQFGVKALAVGSAIIGTISGAMSLI